MIPIQTFESYPVFGNNATKVQPDNSKYSNGFLEGDVYPAEYVNWAWAKNSKGVTDLNAGLNSVEKELNTILTCAGLTPSSCEACVDQVYKSIMCRIEACVGTSAPKAHASSETTYGVGTADCYGHLKISDTYTSVLSACTGVAASQLAVACVYALANGKAAVGSTKGCALGTAAAGTATTAARSDHVHPKPSRTDLGLGTAADYNKKAGASAATYVEYGCCLLAGDFLTYWNGAYNSSGSSNLRYYCGGAFGTAAACAASDFLGASDCATDSAKLNGYASDTGATNNTIARRQANGYLYATYFNQSSGAETATTSSCFMYANSDGFLRKTSVATVKSVLGLGTAAACAATAFLSASGCAADSAKLGGKSPSTLCVECAGRVYSGWVKGKWCMTYCSGSCCKAQFYVCCGAAISAMVFPGNVACVNCASCIPTTPPAACVILSANTWTAIGPAFIVCSNSCVKPACTTTVDVPYIRVF